MTSPILSGTHCSWWDSADRAGDHKLRRGSVKVCPKCGGPLQSWPSEEAWLRQVAEYAKLNPEYTELVNFSRGKCFRKLDDLEKAYNEQE